MSKRIQQINQLIKRELSQIILKEIEFPSGILVTVTRVDTSSNLTESKVYVSVMFAPHPPALAEGGESKNRAERIFQILNRQIYNLQQRLNRRLRMRPIPKIMFVEEKETSEAGRIEEILEKLKSKEK